jgi:hypothetical protein
VGEKKSDGLSIGSPAIKDVASCDRFGCFERRWQIAGICSGLLSKLLAKLLAHVSDSQCVMLGHHGGDFKLNSWITSPKRLMDLGTKNYI